MEDLFELKEYKKEYEAKLIDFLERCLPESGRGLDISGRHAFYMDIENCFKAFLCLFCGEKIIGTVAVKELNKTDCELKSLYLLECYQGRGYGKELLHKAINFARQSGFEKCILTRCQQAQEQLLCIEEQALLMCRNITKVNVQMCLWFLNLMAKIRGEGDGRSAFGQ